MDDFLSRHNDEVRSDAQRQVAEVEARRARSGTATIDPLRDLAGRFATALQAAAPPEADVAMQVDLVARDQHHADIALKFPGLLRRGGPKAFAEQHSGWIVEALGAEALADAVAGVVAVGMYVNITLQDAWLRGAVDTVVDAGSEFGRSAELIGGRYVVDYSSPNVAKTLHAGHIRSTIIGQVLSNVLDAAGATTFRVNHINDFGGFGFTLEGLRRFEDRFPEEMSTNDRSVELYRLRRSLEAAAAGGTFDADASATVERYLPGSSSKDAASTALAEITRAGDARFEALEAGDADEVDLWRVVVEASLAEFQPFYDSLDVQIDFVLGESFYAQVGLALVREWLESGAAVVYSDAEAAVDLAEIDRAVADGGLTDAEADSARAGIEKDNDAVVVRLSATERYVVLRRDGRSVYSTRDLAAIAVRSDLFDPTSCIYVVGQEQQTHFSRLFAAAYRLGLADPDSMAFEHLSFGFYIDPTTKKKLSSRESVAGVAALFSTANDYFAGRVGETVDDPAAVAHQLTIASIVFNDLKQDTKSSVELDVNDPASLLEMFERSGGAYVIYAACRAGAVVRKAAGASAQSEIGALEDDEVALVLELLDTPRRLGSAAKGHDPSVVVRHLLTLSNLYNSYYSRRRVIGPDGVHTDRLRITAATEQVLRNGLRWCNVECPEAI